MSRTKSSILAVCYSDFRIFLKVKLMKLIIINCEMQNRMIID